MSTYDSLTPAQRELVGCMFSTSPSEWPPGAREGVNALAQARHDTLNGEVLVDVIAEWVRDR